MTNIAAIVLAGGASRRFEAGNKLLAVGADGRTVIQRTIDTVVASKARDLVVTLGHAADDIRCAFAAPACVVVASDHTLGIAHSLHAGLAVIGSDIDGVLICLADMPGVACATLNRLIDAWAPGRIVIPMHAGRRGNPVLWDCAFLAELSAMSGDTGGRRLLETYPDAITCVPGDPGILLDADTCEHLRALPGGPWRASDGTPI